MILRKRIPRTFFFNRLALFNSTLKDSFVLAVKDRYRVSYSLSDPISSIGGYKNQKRRSRRLCEDCKEHRMLRLTRYDLRQAKTVNKTLKSHCSYQTSYLLGISLLFLRPSMRYMPKHQYSVSFRPRQSNKTSHLSKTLGFPHWIFRKRKRKRYYNLISTDRGRLCCSVVCLIQCSLSYANASVVVIDCVGQAVKYY